MTPEDNSRSEVAPAGHRSEVPTEFVTELADHKYQAGDHLPGDSPAVLLVDARSDPSACVETVPPVGVRVDTSADPGSAGLFGVEGREPADRRGPTVGFVDMLRFQSALLGVGLLLGYLLGFLSSGGGIVAAGTAIGETASGPTPLWSLDWFGFGLGWTVAIGVGLAVTLLGLVRWMDSQGWAWLSEIERVVQQALVPSLLRCSIWQLACLAALAGVGEELLFRWAIQGGVELGLRWLQVGEFLSVAGWITRDAVTFLLAALVSAFLFGLCHAVTRAYWVLASLMGLVFSLVVVSGGGLLAAILAHGLYDFLVFLMLRREAKWKPSGASKAE